MTTASSEADASSDETTDSPRTTLHYALWGGVAVEDPGADAVIRTCEAIARLRPEWRVAIRPTRLPRDLDAEFRRRGLERPPNLVGEPLLSLSGERREGRGRVRFDGRDRERMEAALGELARGVGPSRAAALAAWRSDLTAPGRHVLALRNPPLLRFFADLAEALPREVVSRPFVELHRLKAGERARSEGPPRDLAELRARSRRWIAEEFDLLARAGTILCEGSALAARLRRGLPPATRVTRLPFAAPPPLLDPVSAALGDEADEERARDIELLLLGPAREPELRLVVEALRELPAGVRLTIAGDRDSTASRLAGAQARVLGVEARIDWLDPPGARVARLRSRARVGLVPMLPSDPAARRGGEPRGVFAFLAAGTPVVASDVPAAREIARGAAREETAPEETGRAGERRSVTSPIRLAPPAPREWARAIAGLLADRHPRRTRRAAREIVGRYGHDARARAWIDAIESPGGEPASNDPESA